MRFTLGKNERLKSKKLIGKLYAEGSYIKVFPLKLNYLQIEHNSNYLARVGVSVSRRNFKRAVDRNKIKRLIRETYRKEKHFVYSEISQPYVFMISYIAKYKFKYADIEFRMKKLLALFVCKIKQNDALTKTEHFSSNNKMSE
ncbi:MAG: ribonuclease P protein component [Tenacibaculum sp.]